MTEHGHNVEKDAGREYAIEADPGRLTASFPIFSTYAEAKEAATQPCMAIEGLPFPRVLSRRLGSDWEVAR
jgi:hypothetical protein